MSQNQLNPSLLKIKAMNRQRIWSDLQTHHQQMQSHTLINLFAEDPQRFNTFSLTTDHLFLDYSKHHPTFRSIKRANF